MPSQNRIRRDNRGQFKQFLSSKHLALGSQQTPLIVGQQDSLVTQFLEKSIDLGILKLDNLLLLFVDPTTKGNEHEVPRLEQETHGISTVEARKTHSIRRIAAEINAKDRVTRVS